MTRPAAPTGPASSSRAAASPSDAASVGNRQQTRSDLDLAALSDRVYLLMLEDLRLELARRTGKVR